MRRRDPVRDDFIAALRVQAQAPRWEILELKHFILHILIISDEAGVLLHEGRWEELNSRYKVRFDRAHAGGKDHFHVAKVNSREDIFAINVDGTGSHDSTGRLIPNEVAKALTKRYGKKIRIPPNNIIEELSAAAATALFG